MYSNKIKTIHQELLVKFVSQICHKNINKPLNGTYLADFGIIDIMTNQAEISQALSQAIGGILGLQLHSG